MNLSNSNFTHSPGVQGEIQGSTLCSQLDSPDWPYNLRQIEALLEPLLNGSNYDVHSLSGLESDYWKSKNPSTDNQGSGSPLLNALVHTLRLLCTHIPQYLLTMEKNTQCMYTRLEEHANNAAELQDYVENTVPEEIWKTIRERVSNLINCKFLELTSNETLTESTHPSLGNGQDLSDQTFHTQPVEPSPQICEVCPNYMSSSSSIDAKFDNLVSQVNSIIKDLPEQYQGMNEKISRLEEQMKVIRSGSPFCMSLSGADTPIQTFEKLKLKDLLQLIKLQPSPTSGMFYLPLMT